MVQPPPPLPLFLQPQPQINHDIFEVQNFRHIKLAPLQLAPPVAPPIGFNPRQIDEYLFNNLNLNERLNFSVNIWSILTNPQYGINWNALNIDIKHLIVRFLENRTHFWELLGVIPDNIKNVIYYVYRQTVMNEIGADDPFPPGEIPELPVIPELGDNPMEVEMSGGNYSYKYKKYKTKLNSIN
jgi:hypothetical protein